MKFVKLCMVTMLFALSLSATAFAEAITITGYLSDVMCATGKDAVKEDPTAHEKACLLMPDCEASGYGVFVDNEAGDGYVFHKFDTAGNDLVKKLLAETKAETAPLVVVEGTHQGDVFAVASLKEAQMVTGYLVDKLCSVKADVQKDPSSHTVDCLQMPDCEASGYGIFVENGDKFDYYTLDKAGSALAKTEVIDETEQEDDLFVEVIGFLEKDVFTVVSIAEAEDEED